MTVAVAPQAPALLPTPSGSLPVVVPRQAPVRETDALSWAQRWAARTRCVDAPSWVQLFMPLGFASACLGMQLAAPENVVATGTYILATVAGVGMALFTADRVARHIATKENLVRQEALRAHNAMLRAQGVDVPL